MKIEAVYRGHKERDRGTSKRRKKRKKKQKRMKEVGAAVKIEAAFRGQCSGTVRGTPTTQ